MPRRTLIASFALLAVAALVPDHKPQAPGVIMSDPPMTTSPILNPPPAGVEREPEIPDERRILIEWKGAPADGQEAIWIDFRPSWGRSGQLSDPADDKLSAPVDVILEDPTQWAAAIVPGQGWCFRPLNPAAKTRLFATTTGIPAEPMPNAYAQPTGAPVQMASLQLELEAFVPPTPMPWIQWQLLPWPAPMPAPPDATQAPQ